jgi:hypothetical protein
MPMMLNKKDNRLDRARDTGMALVLLVLLFAYFGRYYVLLPGAIVLLVINMAWPRLFIPLSRVWFGLSHLLGKAISRIILTLIFFLIVVPIGLLRRSAGADPMQLKKWKDGSSSVFRNREGAVEAKDLENPY